MDSDSILVAKAKAGDYRAFEELVRRHEQWLYSLAYRLLRHRQDAEDVVQNTFLRALERLSSLQEASAFPAWLKRMATNCALDTLRRKSKALSLEEATEENDEGVIPHPEYIADWRGDPRRLYEQKELRRMLAEAIATLEEKYRLVFVLRDLEGVSTQEVAEVLGISEANVKVRLLRARLYLRERLTRIFGDDARRLTPAHTQKVVPEKGTSPKA